MASPLHAVRDTSRFADAQRAGRLRPYLLLALVQVLVAAVFLLDRAPGTRAAFSGLPLDDAWIHLVYARSFAHGQLFSYNPGQPEAGFTSPLWVFVLTPAVWLAELGLPLVPVVKLFGLCIGWLSGVLAFELLLSLSGDRRAAVLAGVLLAVDPWLAFARLSGMEVLLASATVLWTLVEFTRGRFGRASVALALCALARPENAVFVLPAMAWLVWAKLRRGDGLRGVLTAVLPTALTGGAWMAYCLAVIGRPLPTTFYAKHPRNGAGLWLDNLPKLGHLLQDTPWFTFWIGAVLFAVGAGLLLRRGAWRIPSERPLRLLVVAHPLLFLNGIGWAHVLSDEYAFYWSRYFQPVLPFLLLPIAVAMASAFSGVERVLRRELRGAPAVACVVLSLAALVPLLGLPRALRAKADRYAWNCQNIEEMQVALGHWLAEHTAPGDWIAVNDAGAIRFVSNRATVDLTGLNQHEILFGHRQDVLNRLKPKLYAVFPTWFPKLVSDPGFRVVHRLHVAPYTLCDCAQDEVVVLMPQSVE